MRIALGQFNATVGDLAGNVEAMKRMWSQAVEAGADLVLFPELGWVLVPLTTLIAASRVVLGLHYPTDVAAGAVLGFSLASGALALI